MIEVVGSQWGVRVGLEVSKVKNSTHQCQDGTELVVATAAKTDAFATDTVFLSGEGEGSEGGGPKGGFSAREGVAVHGANEELDIRESKRSGIGVADSVLTGVEEKEKGDGNHIGHSEVVRLVDKNDHAHYMTKDVSRNGLDAIGRPISFGVASQLVAEAEVNGALEGEPRIQGPQARERLSNVA